MASEVQVYSVSLACASACAPLDTPREEVERVANAEHPTGIASQWRISEDPEFAAGHPNPCPCNTDESRQHWLLNC